MAQSGNDGVAKMLADTTVSHIETDGDRQRRSSRLNAELDKAQQILAEAEHPVEVTEASNKRVLRKVDLHVLPVVLGVYFLQALDKATLSYASVFGLVAGANLVGLQYSWLGSVVYLAQLVAQPLVAYCLVRFPLGKYLAITVLGWGIVLACTPAATTFPGLLVCRMFLGLFEAGVAPTFIAVTQMWWRRREQPIRLASWYAMNGITNMVGSLLTYGLGHINSPHLASYQIIFLFFGVITVAYSFVVFFFMPDSPTTARFLKGEDKLVALERLRANQQGVVSDVWKWAHVREAAMDLKTWLWAFMMFSISVPSGGISTFGPLIVKSFGYDQFQTILFNIPFGAVQLVATLGGAFIATKLKMKAPVLISLSVPPVIGCVMLLVLPRSADQKAPLLVAYYLISVYPGITPLIYSWSAANTAGETKKRVTTAIFVIAQSAGNVVGPTLYTTEEAPLYARGLRSNLALFIVLIILYTIQVFYLMLLNRKHANKRESMGKTGKVVDRSMEKAKDAFNVDRVHAESASIEESKAFDDRTDMENEDFVYVF